MAEGSATPIVSVRIQRVSKKKTGTANLVELRRQLNSIKDATTAFSSPDAKVKAVKDLGERIAEQSTALALSGENLSNGLVEAYEFEVCSGANPSGPMAKITVSHAVTEEHGDSTAVIEIDNLAPSQVRDIAAGGYIQIVAGYAFQPWPSRQSVFFGTISQISYSFEAGRIRWTISATATPPDIFQRRLFFAETNITVGEALDKVKNALGIRLTFPKSAYGIAPKNFQSSLLLGGPFLQPSESGLRDAMTKEEWTTGDKSAKDVLKDLVDDMTRAFQALGIKRRFVLSPDPSQPYTYNIYDIDVTEAVEIYQFNVETPFVLSAGPQPTTVIEQIQSEIEGEMPTLVATNVEEYVAVTMFDPRIGINLFAQAASPSILKQTVTFKIMHVQHTMAQSDGKDWRTSFGGLIVTKTTTGA